MVSTWRFWSSKSINFGNRQAARLFVLLGTIITAIWYFHRFVLFGIAITYMVSGIISRLAYGLRRRTPAPPPTPSQEVPQTS